MVIYFSGSGQSAMIGNRVEVTEFYEAGILHRTINGTLRKDRDGFYIQGADISWGGTDRKLAKEEGRKLPPYEDAVRLGVETAVITLDQRYQP